MYDEFVEICERLNDKQRVRLILKYILGLPNTQISKIEEISPQALSQCLEGCRNELLKFEDHDNLVDKIQRIFASR